MVSGPLEHSARKKSSVNSDKFSRHLKNFGKISLFIIYRLYYYSINKKYYFSEPENDAESCIKALKFDNLSSYEFDCTWKACCNSRIQYIKSNTTKDILEKWPFYKQPSGYRLV